jgi:hypothetical protein
MTIAALLEEFDRRGVRLKIEAGRIIAKPLSAVPSNLRRAATEHKYELIEVIQTYEALHLLNRLKIFTLPTGRMPAAREIAERCAARLLRSEDGELMLKSANPSDILEVLRDIESELIALGGAPDLLAESVAMIEHAFPGSRLVEVRKPSK